MSINLDDEYLKKLEEYVGKKLEIFKEENEIKFYADWEMHYILEEKDNIYSFYKVERGKRSKLAEYFSEKKMKQRLAINIKGLFGEKIDYSKPKEFNNIKNLEDGKKLIAVYIEPEYYSIMNPEAMKINLEKEKEKYHINFLNDSNEKQYLEKNIDVSFAFSRLYNEARYLKRFFNKIKEYEVIFDDKIEEERLYGLIIHNI